MTTNNSTREPKKTWRLSYDITDRWVNALIQVISDAITATIAYLITAITIVLVVLGGLWLAYTYLPFHVFFFIAALLVADILLGIAARIYMRSR